MNNTKPVFSRKKSPCAKIHSLMHLTERKGRRQEGVTVCCRESQRAGVTYCTYSRMQYDCYATTCSANSQAANWLTLPLRVSFDQAAWFKCVSWPDNNGNTLCLVTQNFPYTRMLFILRAITRVFTIQGGCAKILTHWGHSDKQEGCCIPTLNRTRDVQAILF